MIALVTGASRGIGKVIALQLAQDGYELALVGRDTQALEQVKAEIGAQSEASLRIVTIPADLTQIDSCTAIVEQTVAALGGLDLLVNCAGLSHKGGFTTVTPEVWDRIFAVNARAPFFISQAALPYLKESQKPIVINIASVVGFKGYQDQSFIRHPSMP